MKYKIISEVKLNFWKIGAPTGIIPAERNFQIATERGKAWQTKRPARELMSLILQIYG